MTPKYDNSSVRRQNRLLSEEEAITLLKEGEYGFLAMVTEESSGYGIPLSYVWDGEEKIYFHCALEGKKLNCLKHQNNVTFCVVGKTNVISSQFTTAYESILITGTIQTDISQEERMSALKLLLEKYSPNDLQQGIKYAQHSFERTCVLCLTIEKISGKGRR